MLFSLIAIVVAALALLALVISQLKTREEMEGLRAELTRVSAQASDAALQLKGVARKQDAPAAEKAAPPAPVRVETPAPAAAAPPAIKVKGEAEIPQEILMVISAAVAAFLRKTGRMRSPRPVQGISPWAQQGRVIVQASHNLAAKR